MGRWRGKVRASPSHLEGCAPVGCSSPGDSLTWALRILITTSDTTSDAEDEDVLLHMGWMEHLSGKNRI